MIVSAGFTAPDEGKKLASTAGIYLRQVRAQVAASGKLGEEQPVAEEVTRKLLEMFHASRGG